MQPEIASIVSRAATLWERLDRAHHWRASDPDAQGRDRAAALLETWKAIAAGGDDERFLRRLRWGGWTRDQVRHAVATDVPGGDGPGWSATLREIVAAGGAASLASIPADRVIRAQQPVPFEELLIGAVRVARHRAGLESSHRCAPLAADLERDLLMRLSTLAFPAFFHEFEGERPRGMVLLANLLDGRATPSTERYVRFVTNHLANGALQLFVTYPVLARLCAQAVEFWVEGVSEFRDRLDADWDLLGLPDEPVAGVDPGCSDFHHRHRSVLVLRWDSGRRLVYKPRGLAIDAAYAQLLHWLNGKGAEPPLWAPRTWDRGTYGWVEFVDHRVCSTQDELRRYYERAGMLVCLSRILQSSDLHRDNIIASGEHPVLIDLETIMQPDPHSTAAIGGFALSGAEMRSFNRSVSRSGLLPLFVEDAYGRRFEDVSGLGGIDGIGENPVRTIAAINTDAMRIVVENEAAARGPNNPFSDAAGDPSRFLSAIETGFSRLHDLLVRERDALLAPDGPLQALGQQQLRFVFRSTSSYAAILERSVRIECLTDGSRRSIELDAVSRALLHASRPPRFWPIVAAELAALERMDVPVFVTSAGSTDLHADDMRPLTGCLEDAPCARVLATIRGLDDADKTVQIGVTRGMFQARSASVHGADERVPTPEDREPSEPVTCRSAWLEATVIADLLVRTAVDSSENGAAYWLGLRTHERGFRQFRPVGDALFDGRMGIALFLAAMAAASTDGRYRQVALRAIEPVLNLARRQDQEGRTRYVHSAGIGGLTGIGSTVYGLAWIGTFAAEPELATHATWFAQGLTPEVIRQDRQLDIVNGTAGALLALVSLFERTGDRDLLDRALQCGEHLLDCREPTPSGHRAWRSPAGKAPLAGFSHGASGIGLALLSLFGRTARREFRDAALEGFAYERTLFDPNTINWGDLRDGAGPAMAGWCHGAPGVGLARVAAMRICQDESLAEDLDNAISGTLGLPRAPLDHCCCGEFGRVEFLAEAKQETAARMRASWLSADTQSTGNYRLFTDIQDASNPGFFQGLAGIGYGWLRLARAREFPCVLTLE